MKKMIVIAALIGGMLMPAQIMAQNNRKNEKPGIERRDNNKNIKPGKNNGGKKELNIGKPGKNNRPGFAMNKPGKNNKPGKGYDKPGKYNRPAPPPVVINRPAPRPCPPPPPARYCYSNDCNNVLDAAATVIGIAALVSLIAN